MDKQALVSAALEWISERGLTAGGDPVTGETDLLAAGVLDSMAFVELLAHLEECAGIEIDIADLEPEEFSTLDGLCASAFGGDA